MKRVCFGILALSVYTLTTTVSMASEPSSTKPSADKVLQTLTAGNANFAKGNLTHPFTDKERIALASKSNQGNFATATIISCSDSQVPVEYIFDGGLMNLFVIRVAGNVCNTDEIGSAEYGVCHVNTPVLIVLGHSQCGAVTAVAQTVMGKGHELEANIPPLVAPIVPAVESVRTAFPQVTMDNLVNRSIEANIWQGIEHIFTRSPAIRAKAASGDVTVVGAIYDLETGLVRWLPKEKVDALLAKASGGQNNSPVKPEAHAAPEPEAQAAPEAKAHEPAAPEHSAH
ncbi:MAG TPA: carbonic anhydrase [Verrucomicrobia bacterium]|nr:carbonic anhydrase [Verrucomicrobiota bacterium]